MNVKNNQRTQHTQNRIKEVLIELLGEKPINKITIQDICRKAEVNRTTFYTHFSDIYDLMQKIEIEKMKIILGLLKSDNPEEHALNEKSLEKLLLFIEENSRFYKIYLNDFNISQTIDTLLPCCLKNDNPVLNKGTQTSEIEIYYQLEYLKAGMMGAIRTWLNTDCQESPKELARILNDCIPKI